MIFCPPFHVWRPPRKLWQYANMNYLQQKKKAKWPIVLVDIEHSHFYNWKLYFFLKFPFFGSNIHHFSTFGSNQDDHDLSNQIWLRDHSVLKTSGSRPSLKPHKIHFWSFLNHEDIKQILWDNFLGHLVILPVPTTSKPYGNFTLPFDGAKCKVDLLSEDYN